MMNKSAVFLFILATVFFVSCKKNLPQIGLGEEFTLKYDQCVMINDQNTGKSFKMKFNDVEDLRCPPEFNCFGSGPVTLELKMDRDDKIQISSSTGFVDYEQYKIILLDVSPIGGAKNNKSKRKYAAKLKVI
jgi:hypothetical protein